MEFGRDALLSQYPLYCPELVMVFHNILLMFLLLNLMFKLILVCQFILLCTIKCMHCASNVNHHTAEVDMCVTPIPNLACVVIAHYCH